MIKICFFGASTTEGLGDETRLGWPGRLLADTVAGRRDIVGYNLGIRGQTTSMMKARFATECKMRLTKDAKNIIIMSFGLNDVAEVGGIARMPTHRTVKNVEDIIAMALDLTENILWIGPAPIHPDMMPVTYANGNVFNFDNDRISMLNEDYFTLATKNDIDYLDIFNPLINNDLYMNALTAGDGLHPIGDGYQQITNLIAKWQPWLSCL